MQCLALWAACEISGHPRWLEFLPDDHFLYLGHPKYSNGKQTFELKWLKIRSDDQHFKLCFPVYCGLDMCPYLERCLWDLRLMNDVIYLPVKLPFEHCTVYMFIFFSRYSDFEVISCAGVSQIRELFREAHLTDVYRTHLLPEFHILSWVQCCVLDHIREELFVMLPMLSLHGQLID